jgi:hypothetical protein
MEFRWRPWAANELPEAAARNGNQWPPEAHKFVQPATCAATTAAARFAKDIGVRGRLLEPTSQTITSSKQGCADIGGASSESESKSIRAATLSKNNLERRETITHILFIGREWLRYLEDPGL